MVEIREAEKKEEQWYCCPSCNKKLFPMWDNTRIEHMPYRCKACKHDIEVNVFPSRVNNLRTMI